MKKTTALLLAIISTQIGCTNYSPPAGNSELLITLLNQRYQDTSEVCRDGSAAFHCNGVLVRVTKYITSSPDELERNTVAFSYMRSDTRVTGLYRQGAQGIILSPPPTSSTNVLSVRCAFPTNALTDTRPDGCGETTKIVAGLDPAWSRHCDEQGIDNTDSWYLHYLKIRRNEAYMCAFRPSAQQFALSIKARNLMLPDFTTPWNEVVTSAWRTLDLKRMPFQAFFFNPAAHENLIAAQKLQLDFYRETGINLPIVRIDLRVTEPPTHIFSYHKSDQLLLPIP